MNRLRLGVAAALAGVLVLSNPPTVQGAAMVAVPAPAAEFYKGRDVHLLVGAAAGGGYDLYARFFARHLPEFLPIAHVIVENLPTAGGLAMENTLFNVFLSLKQNT